jgi:hypothetical protein
MSLQSKFVVSDLFREATAVCNANTSHWMSAIRGTKLLFAREANRINMVGQSSPRDDNAVRCESPDNHRANDHISAT